MTTNEITVIQTLGSDLKQKKVFRKPGERPSKSLTVAFGENGQSVSKYGDLVWDFSAYLQSGGHCKINFQSCRYSESKDFDNNVEEIKWLIFIYINHNTRGRGGIISAMTLSSLWKTSLKSLLEYSASTGISVKSVLESSDIFRDYIFTTNPNTTMPGLSSCMRMLIELGEELTGYKVFGGKTLDELREYVLRNRERKQTPVIPERILSHCIVENNRFIEEFMANRGKLTKLIKSAQLYGPSFGLACNTQAAYGLKRKVHLPYFDEVTKDHGLVELFSNNNVSSMLHVSRYLKSVQLSCKTLIHIFTGMREKEVLSLTYECLEKEVFNKREVIRIVGNTFKLERLSRRTSWVTSKDVIEAVQVAQSVNTMVSIGSTGGDDRLFISTAKLFVVGRKTKKYNTFSLAKKHQKAVVEITEDDLLQLERYTPSRDWRSEENFQVGDDWPFASHQFRRSIAFYAAQSGLVSLPTLKTQLQHVAREMSIHYAAGASATTTLFSSETSDFVREYQETKIEADATAWLFEVIASEDKLYGPLGKILEKQKNCNGEVNIIEDIEEAKKRFSRGEIALKETPCGFCTSVEPCTKRAMRSVFACVSCDKAIIKKDKLQIVSDAYVSTLDVLDSDSIEYLMELEASNDVRNLLQEIKSS